MKTTHKFDLKYSTKISFMDCFTGKNVDCSIVMKENSIPTIELNDGFYSLNDEEKVYFKLMVNKLKEYIDEI